jgi:hypothetical protein
MMLCAGKELTHVEVRHDVGEGKKFAVRKRSVACVVWGTSRGVPIREGEGW